MSTDISNSLYASKRKQLLALINQLRAVGAQNDLDLPRITVIGNQSAGKSSVVEAISGITVPRDAGTCTRCPMECRLSASPGSWSCRISIRKEYDRDGTRTRKISEVPFGTLITDKSQVELALRRAQFAILNPEVSLTNILGASAQELKDMATEKSIPFSQNVVCVDLEGPELTDLSFIDLPGIIQNAEPEVVQLVEEMVVSHIKGNCIILVAIPMTDDIENQKALRLASQEDKDGRRTIGVLTKPDMLGTGSTKSTALWLDVIEDRRHQLRHGYYCTRRPDDDQRSAGIEPEKAREAEEKFFRGTAPWSGSTNPGRFGTKNLVGTLSRLLVQIIDENLPKIYKETSRQLADCRAELDDMPKPVTDEPATHVLSLITELCSEFQTLVGGRADAAKLIRSHRKSYGAFKRAIRKTAPIFVPFAENEKIQDFNNCLSDEEDDPVANVSVTDKPSMNLTEIRKHVDQSVTRELPNNVPYDAKAILIVRFQAKWPEAVEHCFKDVEDATSMILLKIVEERCGRFSLLQIHIRNFVKILMEEHKRTCTGMLGAILETERMPYTQNGYYLETSTQAWLGKYKAVRSGKSGIEEQDPQTRRRKVPDPAPASPFGSGTGPFSFSNAHNNSEPPTVGTEGTSSFGNASTFNSFGASATRSAFGASALKSKPASASSNSPFEAPADPPSSKPTSALPFPFGAPTQAVPSTARTFGSASVAAKPASHPDHVTYESATFEKESIDGKVVQEALALLVKAGLPVASFTATELVGKLAPLDEYEKELKVASEVRGYFQIAYKRMIDNVPRFIDLLFVRALGKTLQPFLISRFGMGTPEANERCASYLGEDQALVAKREELLARQKRLESVEKDLEEYSLRA